jgi:AcrR family transcriptional regulator
MPIKEDLRVKRTKKALAEAFVNLLKAKPLDDITINELCETADVRRATFYKHYNDKFDFIAAFTGALRDEFDRDVWAKAGHLDPKEYFAVYAKEAIAYIDEHSVAVDNLIKSNLFPAALSVIIEQNYKDTRDKLNEFVKNGLKLQASVEVTASIFAGGVASAIFCWLTEGKPISADELSDQVYKFLISTLKEA